jgi:hypothetical protein
MPVQEDLTVPYHQQDTSYYCGAACAQMVIASPDVGGALLDQDDLYTDNHSHSLHDGGAWATGPDGLQWTMNDRRPPGFTGWFALYEPTSEDTISRKIVWTIHHYNVAPIALVFGSAHWIVVRGFDASDAPASSTDTGYSITAFDVNNPWPPVPSWSNAAAGPPPPHGGSDGCGTGGDRGVANEHITYATWQSTYMTGVSFGHWNGKFVAVCDPDPPATQPGRMAERPKRLDGVKLIEPKKAAKLALAGLDAYGLAKRNSWKPALDGTEPAAPMLVQRLDRDDSFYYIVPLERSKRRASVAALVDARFGDYMQAISLGEADNAILPQLSLDEAMKRVVGKRFELPRFAGRLLVRPEALCLGPVLVWKPCRESLSPYWPFYQVRVGGHTIYIRIDGAVFTELHEDDHGI